MINFINKIKSYEIFVLIFVFLILSQSLSGDRKDKIGKKEK